MEPEETTITSVPARLDPRDVGGQRGQPVGAQRIAPGLHQQGGADLDHQPPRIGQPGRGARVTASMAAALPARRARRAPRRRSARAGRAGPPTSPVRATPDMVITGSARRRLQRRAPFGHVVFGQARRPCSGPSPAACRPARRHRRRAPDDRLVIGHHILRRAVDQVQAAPRSAPHGRGRCRPAPCPHGRPRSGREYRPRRTPRRRRRRRRDWGAAW
jgi:hypothetical protein